MQGSSSGGVGLVVATMAHMSHGLQRFPQLEAKQWKVGVLQQLNAAPAVDSAQLPGLTFAFLLVE